MFFLKNLSSLTVNFKVKVTTSTKRGYISFYQTVIVIMCKIQRFESMGTSKYYIATVTFQVYVQPCDD